MASHQYVYVMNRLSKAWPGGKEVLKNVSLSFFLAQRSVFWG
jgi:hypothetical protein